MSNNSKGRHRNRGKVPKTQVPQVVESKAKKIPQITALAGLQDVNSVQEKEQKSLKQSDWFPFFKDSDNIYINDLAKRAKRSPTHGAILQSKGIFTAGQGFTYFQNGDEVNEEDLDVKFSDYIKGVNGSNDSLHSIFGKSAYDLAYSGNVYLEIKKGKEFTSVFYLDASKVRVSKKNAYVSAWWHVIKDDPSQVGTDYPVETIELWNGKEDTSQKHFIIHLRNDVPEYDYYGLPESIQVLKWADIEYKIGQFNLSKLENGFFPSVLMTLVGTPPEGMNEQQYVEAIVSKYTGEEKNGKIVAQMVDSADQAPIVTEFTGASEGEMLQLQTTSRDMIISGHRWFPSLAGIATAGQLGSNQQIRNEYNIALKGLIIPQYQNPLLRMYNTILKIAGFDIEINVLNVAPVGFEDTLDAKIVLTEDEQRAALGYAPKTDEQLSESAEETPEETKKEEE
jgi:hypothetical protein